MSTPIGRRDFRVKYFDGDAPPPEIEALKAPSGEKAPSRAVDPPHQPNSWSAAAS